MLMGHSSLPGVFCLFGLLFYFYLFFFLCKITHTSFRRKMFIFVFWRLPVALALQFVLLHINREKSKVNSAFFELVSKDLRATLLSRTIMAVRYILNVLLATFKRIIGKINFNDALYLTQYIQKFSIQDAINVHLQMSYFLFFFLY